MKAHAPTRNASVLRVLVILSCLTTLVVGVVGLAIYRTLTVGGDLRAARNVVLNDLKIRCHSQVQVSAHPWLVGLVRFGLSFAPLEPEARLAIKTIRGAEIGVYQLASTPDAAQRLTLFQKVDQRMTKRGWHRTVAVFDQEDMVMVYAPTDERAPDDFEAFVFVLDGQDLVLVSGAGNLEPLVELVDGRLAEKLPALAAWRR